MMEWVVFALTTWGCAAVVGLVVWLAGMATADEGENN